MIFAEAIHPNILAYKAWCQRHAELGTHRIAGLTLEQFQALFRPYTSDSSVIREDLLSFLPIVPERLVSLLQKVRLLDQRATIDPLDLLWRLPEIEGGCAVQRPQKPYSLSRIQCLSLQLKEGESFPGAVRQLKDQLSDRGAQPLSTNELVDLVLVQPELLECDRIVAAAGYSAKPLPELVRGIDGLVLQLTDNPDEGGRWMIPIARHILV